MPVQRTPDADIFIKSRQELVSIYNKRASTFQDRIAGSTTSKRRDSSNSKYSDELIVSFRSACQAKDNIGTRSLGYAAIGRLHNIHKDYCIALRTNYTLRPHCLPDQDLVTKFEAEFRAGIVESRHIKASRKTNKQSPDDIPAVKGSQKAITYQSVIVMLKKYYGEYPTIGMDSLLMIQELLSKKIVTLEWGEAASTLIFRHSYLFDELDPEKTPATITNKPLNIV